jgi:hypothetical protein
MVLKRLSDGMQNSKVVHFDLVSLAAGDAAVALVH